MSINKLGAFRGADAAPESHALGRGSHDESVRRQLRKQHELRPLSRRAFNEFLGVPKVPWNVSVLACHLDDGDLDHFVHAFVSICTGRES